MKVPIVATRILAQIAIEVMLAVPVAMLESVHQVSRILGLLICNVLQPLF